MLPACKGERAEEDLLPKNGLSFKAITELAKGFDTSRSPDGLTIFGMVHLLASAESIRARSCALTDFCGEVLTSAEKVAPTSRPKRSDFEKGSDAVCKT